MVEDRGVSYLHSDQGTEGAVLDKLTEIKEILESLTFEKDDTLQNGRTRDIALLQCKAMWTLIYYANGS